MAMRTFLLIPILLILMTITACENIAEVVDNITAKEAPKAAVVNPEGKMEYYDQPSGTYTAKIMGVKYKATFYPTTDVGKLKLYDEVDGEQIFEYRIVENGKILYAGNTKTGIPHRFRYTYNKQFDTVKLDGTLYTK